MMKKNVLSVLTASALLASVMTVGVAAAAKVDGRKTCEAYIANITLDGKLDDAWKYAPTIPVTTVKENASSYFGDTSKKAGTDYATLDCKVLWDGHNTLYMLYVVKDKTISLAGANAWEKDSIEYFIQPENSTDSGASKTQIRMMADNSGSDISTDTYGYAATSDGFIYEISVDISAVGGAGQYFGIDFQYNDDAEGKGVRNACLGWSDAIDKASSDPSVYGQCLLSSTTVADLIEAEKAAAEKAAASGSAATGDPTVILLAASVAGIAGTQIFRRRK